MPVITITGLSGSGSIEVGSEVSKRLGIDYVDRLILAEAARKIGTTVAAVADRTERSPTLGDRVASFVRTVLERSALAGTGGDPYFGGGVDALLVREYRDIPTGAEGQDVSDKQLMEVTASVIREIAQSEKVVIIGRGANVILRDWPGALHVGMVSSLEHRIERIIERERLSHAEAEKYIAENDKARTAYYHRFFKCQPEDPHQYHLVLNLDWLDIDRAADGVIQFPLGAKA